MITRISRLIQTAILTLTAAALAAGCGSIENVTMKKSEVNRMAAEIAEYDLPEGFDGQYAATVEGITVASFSCDNPDMHLFMAQAGPDSEVDEAALENALIQSGERRTDRGDRMVEVSREERVVRGEPGLLIVSEGVNGSGKPYKQANLFFQGKNGLAMASVGAPSANWDEPAAANFFSSIR